MGRYYRHPVIRCEAGVVCVNDRGGSGGGMLWDPLHPAIASRDRKRFKSGRRSLCRSIHVDVFKAEVSR